LKTPNPPERIVPLNFSCSLNSQRKHETTASLPLLSSSPHQQLFFRQYSLSNQEISKLFSYFVEKENIVQQAKINFMRYLTLEHDVFRKWSLIRNLEKEIQDLKEELHGQGISKFFFF
jgi:hypothetical protein